MGLEDTRSPAKSFSTDEMFDGPNPCASDLWCSGVIRRCSFSRSRFSDHHEQAVEIERLAGGPRPEAW